MPALIGVSEFVEESSADYKSPITSTFVSRMNNMRQTISTLEEVSDVQFKPEFWLNPRVVAIAIHHRG